MSEEELAILANFEKRILTKPRASRLGQTRTKPISVRGRET